MQSIRDLFSLEEGEDRGVTNEIKRLIEESRYLERMINEIGVREVHIKSGGETEHH
jgi:hypothetical protein